MPLFESQEQRDRRLFRGVLVSCVTRTHREGLSPMVNRLYGAWVEAGVTVARHAVYGCESLRLLWGRGSERRATAVTSVFVPPIISRWYRGMYEGRDPLDWREDLEFHTGEVMRLFGGSGRGYRGLMNLDTQHNLEQEWWERAPEEPAGPFSVEVFALLLMARQALGGLVRVDLSRLGGPGADGFIVPKPWTRRDMETASPLEVAVLSAIVTTVASQTVSYCKEAGIVGR